MKVLCPYCEQDMIWDVRLKSDPGRHFKMCFECDSVWTATQKISDQEGSRFDTLMKTWGLSPDWNNIERIQMAQSPMGFGT
jgi:hypothetical protein